MRDKKAVKKARKIGSSVMLTLTGFIQDGCFYVVEQDGDHRVIITRANI